jgi:hypothetical protein
MAFILIVLMLALLPAAPAAGQATQPSSPVSGPDVVEAAWERQVSSLAAAVAAHDAPALQALIPAACGVRRFSGQRDPDIAAVVDYTSDKAVLGDHAYLYPPATIAADIARDVTASSLVSDFIKKALAFDEKRDQPVVMRWLAQSLGADEDAPIAVIVVWETSADPDDHHRPNFILIKGEKDGDAFRFSQIVYGDPLD